MKQVLTLVCKLQPTPEQAHHLDETLTLFAEACAYIHTTLPAHIRNKDRMQAVLYYDVRSRFQLSANLAIQAIRRVAMNLGRYWTLPRPPAPQLTGQAPIFSVCIRNRMDGGQLRASR